MNIIEFSEPEVALETAGGKGLNLARTTQAGLPVPEGFIISTAVYRRFIAENHLEEVLREAQPAASRTEARQSEAENCAAAEQNAAADLIAAFTHAALPADLRQAIAAAYQRLCAAESQPDLPVAVRSSATAEDLSGASFAGQQETYLNIRGEAALIDAVQRCFASLWNERAVSYRAHQHPGAPEADLPAIAVVVQRMVFANVAGVMFTADPASASRDLIAVDAAWGLGEALVSGLVTPDHLVINKRTGRIVEQSIALKTVMTVPTQTGTQEIPVPENRQSMEVLNPRWAVQLAALARQVEAVYHQPMDVEWAIQDSRLFLLQARPITTLPPFPVQWQPPTGDLYMHGGGSLEMVIEPVSPLFATFGIPIFAQVMTEQIAATGARHMLSQPILTTLNGYVYVNLHLRLHPLDLPGLLRLWRVHMDSMKVQDSELVLYRAAVETLARQDFRTCTPTQLLEVTEALARAGMRYWWQIMKVVQPIYRNERRFIEYYTRRIRREGDPEPEIFLRGQKIRPWEAECAAYALAKQARTLQGVPQAITGDGETVIAALRRLRAGEALEDHPLAVFAAALNDHLERYGQQLFSFDPRMPTLADDPRAVLAEINSFLQGKEPPTLRQERMAAEREAAVARIVARLSAAQRAQFSDRLTTAQHAAALREDSLFEVGLAWTPMHRALLEFGQRLVDCQAIAAPDDVFWLEWSALNHAAVALERGEALPDLRQPAAEGRMRSAVYEKLSPPYLLPVGAKPRFWWGWIFPVPEQQNQDRGNELAGLGVSPGSVIGVARVIERPEDMQQLNPGEILVAHTTTPAWTPLFARAAGLVTDMGGPLAHGSIVAREYGIPAVMGVGNATRRIRSGQIITVLGSQGRVILSE